MYDSGKVLTGIAVFLLLVSFPFWHNLAFGVSEGAPKLPKVQGAEHCIDDTAYIKANHMQLLIEWRDEVVRENNREYTSPQDGKKYTKSLTNGCLKCHESNEKFCQKCHDYAGVDVYCWDCHLAERRGK